METAALKPLTQRIFQRIFTFLVYFILWIVSFPLVDRLWPPPEPFHKTVKFAALWALLMTIFNRPISRWFRRNPDAAPPRTA